MTNIQQELEILEEKIGLNYLLFLLSRRAYSSFELKKKLKDRLFSPGSIETILERCSHCIDDEELESSVIRVEASRGKGERAIIEKLVSRMGKNRDEMGEKVRSAYSSEKQEDKAVSLLKKKYNEILDYQQQAKALRFLVGRGFSYPVAKEALSKVLVLSDID